MPDGNSDINQYKPNGQVDNEDPAVQPPTPEPLPGSSKPVKPWWENPGIPTTTVTGDIGNDSLWIDRNTPQYKDDTNIQYTGNLNAEYKDDTDVH